ncbi:MAG: AbiH family protein [Lactobacillus crispatus]|uniref:AbiH family protein n=2 Tax=Bacillota TaxID=1239 RepID=UPI0029746DFF|nr:AbiH family protein [Lactobacillus amylovorus]MDY5246077.1 AbiH family protein [Ligilactobacillus salivarius]MDY5291543.1 AbiH family protein [Ligilactobacillus salivarius]
MKQLLILGNGFDIACGLESRYCDFFKWRFSRLFHDRTRAEVFKQIKAYVDNGISWKDKDATDITMWDYIFLCASICLEDKETAQWQDVENIIFNVVSLILIGDNYTGANLTFKSKIDSFEEPGKIIFVKFIRKISEKNGEIPETAINLLIELKKFEVIFASYINEIMEKHKELDSKSQTSYKYMAEDLLKRLVGIYNGNEPFKDLTTDVFSFNYSLNEYNTQRIADRIMSELAAIGNGKYTWKLNLWDNIHGVADYQRVSRYLTNGNSAPRPIFGIDNHNILADNIENDPRIIFTKSFRIVNDNVNNIRLRDALSNYDLVTVYGHSLGRADYSYFETFFDKGDLYNSNVRLEFYYYSGETEKDRMINAIKYNKAVNNLLTYYGQTMGTLHGEDIVNKLTLEKRLTVKPNPNFIPTQYSIIH